MQVPESSSLTMVPAPKAFSLLRALRIKQWTKNLIVFAPLLFAGKANDHQLLVWAVLCFVSFCLISSSVYCVNDIRDKEVDKLHPRKSKRPIASGTVSVNEAVVLAVLLALAGIALSFVVRPALILVLTAYLALSFGYTYVFKYQPIVDVLSIATGFLLRAVAGAVAVHVPMSGWFLLCSGLGSVYLALEKRRGEITLLQGNADAHRAVLPSYTPQLLDRLESLVLPSLMTSYVFYSFLSVHGQWMMLTVPFVVYGLMRYQQLSCSGENLTAAPEEVLLKDRPIQITIFLWLVTSALVVYGGIETLLHDIVHAIDSLQVFHG